MENFELLEKDLLSISEGRIIKGKNNPVLGIIFFVLGVLISYLSTIDIIAIDGLKIFAFSVGFVLLIYGIIKMFVRGDFFVDTVSNLKLQKEELYFDISDFEKIMSCYREKKFSKINNLKKANQSAGVLLTIYGTPDGTLYYSQVSKFVPYQYVAVTPSVVHTENENVELLTLITNYKRK